VVTGAGGTVGQAVLPALAGAGLGGVGLARDELDVTDRAAVQRALHRVRPAAVVHLAALTDLDACERDRQAAFDANVAGTEHVARACREAGARLIYVSTGGVFGGRGTDGPFHELDLPEPANWYATTKLAGERAAAATPGALTVRAGWVVGSGREDPKFVGKMLRAMERSREVRAVTDRVGTLTFASDLAAFLVAALREEIEGLWHYASPGVVSRYDIALELAAALGLDVRVEPVSHTAFPAPAARGRSEAVCSVRKLGRLPLPQEWQPGLRAHVANVLGQAAASR
jgi:dTDP-4-dehydrorhamnose reductase